VPSAPANTSSFDPAAATRGSLAFFDALDGIIVVYGIVME
jgi:hypothetical protein